MVSRRRPAVIVAVVAALAVLAVGVLVAVRVADSGGQGTTPARHIQVVDSSPKSGRRAGTSGSRAEASTPGAGTSGGGAAAPARGAVGSSGSVSVDPGGRETNGPSGLPGDGGELPAG